MYIEDIHLKFNTCFWDHNCLQVHHYSRPITLTWILIEFITLSELRKFLVEVLHVTSIFKTTEGIHLKFNTCLQDHFPRVITLTWSFTEL